ncbi:hypothetical protein DYQ05_13070 [Treponema pedis]|nr:hypothetical protein DYQ05_13070 [Treponema pedis]
MPQHTQANSEAPLPPQPAPKKTVASFLQENSKPKKVQDVPFWAGFLGDCKPAQQSKPLSGSFEKRGGHRGREKTLLGTGFSIPLLNPRILCYT